MSRSVRAAASAAGESPIVETGARLGYAASGVLHVLVAWVALQLAWFHTGGEADQTGALHALSSTGLGALPLWIAVVGFGLLGVWQVTEAVLRRDGGDRVRSTGKGVAYLALGWTTAAVARGAGSSSSQQSVDATASLMGTSFGRALVAAGGFAVVGVGIYHVVKGWRATFLDDLREHPGRWAVTAGRLGYTAKGVALVLVGVLFVTAAVTRRPEQARGLDGALKTLLDAPFGALLLTVVALGLVAYGVYSSARARYARV